MTRRRVIRIPIRQIVLVVLSIAIVLGVFLGSKATLEEGRLSADAWRSFVVNGVARGSVYALIAMGYTLVAGILYMINFAHGEVFMTGTFISFFFARPWPRLVSSTRAPWSPSRSSC